MNVLFDDQIFHYQRFGGISRYFFEMFIRFGHPNEIRAVIPFHYTSNEYLLTVKEQYHFVRPSFLGDTVFPGKGRVWTWRDKIFPRYNCSLQNRKSILQRLSKSDIDIFHPTYYDDYYSEATGSVPIVLTIYDMIYERFPESFPSEEVREVLANKKKAISRANHLIVISESVKNDLIKYYSVSEEKISVIYLGNSLKTLSGNIRPALLDSMPSSYLLFVGNRDGYKNFLFAIRALRDVLMKHDHLHIICTGNSFSKEEMDLFGELGISDRMHHHFASDNELSGLYSNARAFIYPSKYEGFGMPIIEAMSNGCPVIMSNTSSFPEIGGDAGSYFDPENASTLRSAVTDCLDNDLVHSELVRKGYERAALFSWERTVNETGTVYRTVLKLHQKKS